MQDINLYSFGQIKKLAVKMPLITVYDSPDDYKGKYVARIFDVIKPTQFVIVKNSLADIRKDIKKVFPYMVPIARSPEDVPSVVETWM